MKRLTDYDENHYENWKEVIILNINIEIRFYIEYEEKSKRTTKSYII